MRGCFILRLVRSRCYESENKGEIDKKEDNEQRQQERRQGEVGKAARGRMNAPTKTRRTATRKWRKEDWDDEPESCAHAAAAARKQSKHPDTEECSMYPAPVTFAASHLPLTGR